jgi:DNA topoisomerase VI subunit B
LERVAFTTSRMLDFFSEKELTAQTGHDPAHWPLVILKELADNSLDACEESGSGTAPQIEVTVDGEGITVADNGPGIPQQTIDGVLDYSVRVSSREAYVAPDRGAQGNALKTLMTMPFVLDRTSGRVTVTARGVCHEIEVGVDPLRQVPVINIERIRSDVKTGTRFTVHWPESASSILDAARGRFFQIASDFAWLNPHLGITVDWAGKWELVAPATEPGWPKWKPNEPTSPHWYTTETLGRLIAAFVTHPEHGGMSLREFVSQFRGLTGPAKPRQVLEAAGMSRLALADLVNGGGPDSVAIRRLLTSMRDYSRPVKPAQLGVIGRDHLAARLARLGMEEESFAYKRAMGKSGGRPWVVEAAFGWCPDLGYRRLVTGINWSPGLVNLFRQLLRYGGSLDTLLERQRVDEDCVMVLHLACPLVAYGNRGKSEVLLPPGDDISDALTGAVEAVTKKWAAQRKAEERHAYARLRRREAMTRTRRVTVKEAAFAVMEPAYLKASSDGRLFANARQVMYAARPGVLELTGGKIWADSAYFTQVLLPEYIEQHGLEGIWKIAYDARGHLVEPHRGRLSGGQTSIALGTLEVRKYLAASPDDPLAVRHLPLDFPTAGPEHRYSAAVFVEKEGFDQLIAESGLADKYDVAFMSTKGMSVTAARELVDYLASLDVRILIVRDFDRAGFSIAGTLTTSSKRYRFKNKVNVTDLGLRLADVEAHGLESEPWREKVSCSKIVDTLHRHGATEQEVAYLIGGHDRTLTWGQRVELNAFTSEQFIGWLEDKLIEHGIEKVVPDEDTLALQYRRALARQAMNKKISEMEEQVRATADETAIPDGLADRVRDRLDDDPSMTWDEAVAEIADDGSSDAAEQ